MEIKKSNSNKEKLITTIEDIFYTLDESIRSMKNYMARNPKVEEKYSRDIAMIEEFKNIIKTKLEENDIEFEE